VRFIAIVRSLIPGIIRTLRLRWIAPLAGCGCLWFRAAEAYRIEIRPHYQVPLTLSHLQRAHLLTTRFPAQDHRSVRQPRQAAPLAPAVERLRLPLQARRGLCRGGPFVRLCALRAAPATAPLPDPAPQGSCTTAL
jgi:hypothetical protein